MLKIATKKCPKDKIAEANMVRAELTPLEEIYTDGNGLVDKDHQKNLMALHADSLNKYQWILDALGLEPGEKRESHSPFTPPNGMWRQDKNKRSLYIEIDNKTKKTLVAKGIGNFDPTAQEREDNPFPIQISRWFISSRLGFSYGLTFSCAKHIFNIAEAYRYECIVHGASANTLEPLALLKLKEIPVLIGNEMVVAVPVEKYISWQINGIAKEDRLEYTKLLRDKGVCESTITKFFDSVKPVTGTVRRMFYNCLKSEMGIPESEFSGISECDFAIGNWRPSVILYIADAANLRVNQASKEQILDAWHAKPGGETTAHCIQILNKFAKNMAQIAFFHKVGGDFGGIDGELNERNVTVKGDIMDLESCSMPYVGPWRYGTQRYDVQEAEQTIHTFATKLKLNNKADEAISLFRKHYKKNIKAKPNRPNQDL